MSFVEKLAAVAAQSSKSLMKVDGIIDLLGDIAAAAQGVPVMRDEETGGLVDLTELSAEDLAELDQQQNQVIVELVARVSDLENQVLALQEPLPPENGPGQLPA